MDRLSEISRNTFEKTSEGPQIVVKKDDLPWLQDSEEVRLKKMYFLSGKSAYIASVVRGRRLIDAASDLNKKKSEIVNRLFYSCLPDFVENGYNPHVKRIDGQITKRPIFSVGNPDGQRVYFTRLDNLNGIPVILRIAACSKNRQVDVLSEITHRTKSEVKKKGLG